MTSSPSPPNYMYMFCGDSHVRQFQAGRDLQDYSGWDTFSLTSFLGATMKGLASDRGMLGHGQAIMTLATVPTPKTLFLMFGHVDLDVTWFRKSVLEGEVDEKEFFRQRLDALTSFVKECQRVAGDVVRRVCVILPQLPTLADPHFNKLTAQLTQLEEHQLSELAAAQDCSQLARCHRTARFNEYISQSVPSEGGIAVYRIDDQMADGTGLVLPRFVRDGFPDTHPNREATLPLWWDLLKEEMKHYRMMDALSRRALGQPSGALQELDDVGL
jgi:hypothetical protein